MAARATARPPIATAAQQVDSRTMAFMGQARPEDVALDSQWDSCSFFDMKEYEKNKKKSLPFFNFANYQWVPVR